MTETTITVPVGFRQKMLFIPEPVQPQPLERVIEQVFNVPVGCLTDRHRLIAKMNAKHLYRAIIERILKDGTVATIKPVELYREGHFKYSLSEIGTLCNCGHCNIIWSCRTVRNLMKTDKRYRDKCQIVIDKINNNQILLP